MVKIYGLVCPLTHEIRYIGKTQQKISKRLKAHITDARVSTYSHKRRWIRKCLSAGLTPSAWILAEVMEGDRWQDVEKAWIKRAKEIGLHLTNQTSGGEGLDFTDPEALERYRVAQSIASKRARRRDPTITQRLSAASRKSWAENREERLAACRSGWTDETRKKLSYAMQAIRERPGYKEERSKHAKKIWESSREKILKSFSDPSCKSKQSESKKRSWSDPDTRKRMMNRWTPESRAKQAIALQARQDKIKAAMTPEVRAKQAAKLKETWAKKKAEKLNDNRT